MSAHAASRRGLGTWLLVAAGVVIAATVISAILVMGSPSVQRERRMDEVRVSQLMEIERAVRMFQEREGRLPVELSELARIPGLGLRVGDPQNGTPYEYAALASNAFTLCAVFARNSAEDAGRQAPALQGGLQWRHAAGRHCFPFTIKPQKQ